MIFNTRINQKEAVSKVKFCREGEKKRKLKIKTLRLTAFPAIIRFIGFKTASFFNRAILCDLIVLQISMF